MDEKIKQALENDRWIDITTLGRKTGQHRRIEIGIHNVEGEYYITGRPGKRSWYANMLANEQFSVHLKEATQKNLRAKAAPIQNEAERREIFAKLLGNIQGEHDMEEWVTKSPLVQVTFLDE